MPPASATFTPAKQPQRRSSPGQICWFVLCSGLAVVVFGVALLTPRFLRNQELHQKCYEQQLELITLQEQNSQRLFLLQKLQSSLSLVEQIQQTPGTAAAQHISLPEVLSIHPDSLLHSQPLTTQTGTTQTDIEPRLNALPVSNWQQQLHQLTASPDWQKWLYGSGITLLLLGHVTWRRQKIRRWKQKTRRQVRHWFSRYLHHPPQPELEKPHWQREFQPDNPSANPAEFHRASSVSKKKPL